MKLMRRLLPLFLLLASFTVHAQKSGDDGRQATPAANSTAANNAEIDETREYKESAVVKKLATAMHMTPAAAATIFEVVNFAILAAAVLWFLGKALPKTFRARTSNIQKDLVDARSATEEASQRLNSVEERLAKLDGQIAEMRLQAERDLAADEVRIKASVEEETKKILAGSEQEIVAATQHAQRQLQQYASELAIEQAARKLVISAETDRLLVQGFVRRLGGEQKGGQN